MSNALTISKKAFTWTVVIATIVWATSVAFIVLPVQNAQAATAGDLIRGTVKSPYGGYPVYYYGSDGKRHLYPTSSTYESWHGMDFSAVKVMTEAEVGAIPLGANVFIRPGSKLVKDEGSDPKVYAVAANGTRRHVSSEAVALALYGADWAKGIVMVPTGFFSTYVEGTAVAAAADYDKAAVLAAAPDVGTAMGLAATPAAVVATGSISAALASDNPGAAVLPGGASSAVVLKFNVTAGSTAQTITSVVVKSVGVGSANDFSAVYLYEGASRLTSGRTLAAQTRSTEFAALNLSVGANSTRSFAIVADVNSLTAGTVATAGDTHAFQVTALGTTASVSGLPLTGATNSIGSQGVSTVTLQRGSDPANPTIGQENVAIGEFRLTAGTNDVEFRRAVVTVGGTVSVSDLSNFALYQAGTKLVDGTVSSDRVTFDLSGAPYALSQGTNRLFTVKATVSGRGGRTVATYIDSTYPTDLLVVDKVYSYGATVTFTSFAAVATAAATPATGGSFVTTQGGRVTVAFNGPPAADVALGTQDVVFYKFSLTAGDQALDIREVELTLAEAGAQVLGVLSNGTTNYFTDVKIKDADTGAVLMGPVELSGATITSGTSTTVASSALWDNDFTQSWTLNAGQTRNLVVTMDVASSEVTANDITTRGWTVTLNDFPAGSIREVSTNQNVAVADIVGGQADVTGNTMTVRASSLTVQLASTPVSGTTVRGSTAVEMVGFSFAAGSQSPVRVTQIVMTGQGDNTGGTYTAAEFDDVVLTARLYDGDTPVSTAKSPTTAGVITFDNLDWTVPAGATKKLVARVNLATSLMSAATDTAWLGINAAADITAQDKDSNTVTATDGDATWSNPINSAPTVLLTVNNVGTLTVARDGDNPLAAIVVGGTNDVSLLKVRFNAANEAFDLKKLRITNDGTDSTGTACDGSETTPENASACDTGVVQLKLKYPKADGTTGTKTSVLSSGEADFSDLDAYLALDKNAVIEVLADLATITAAGVSGDQLQAGLDLDQNFEAVGRGSGTTISTCAGVTAGTGVVCTTAAADTLGADLEGNNMTVRKSKPTVTLHAASPSGASVPGVNEQLRFTVSADASSDVVLDVLTFKATLTDNNSTDWNVNGDATGTIDTVAAWSLYESSDLTTQLDVDADWTLYGTAAADGTLSGTEEVGYARLVLTTPRTISAGTSKTYVLKVDTTGASTNPDDSVRFDILEEGGSTNTTLAALAEFQWDESSSGAATDISGTLIKNLPIIGGTLIY
ncbi:hypothetical protein HY477_02235 [Candidatus Uhrbacteria bacterium]|nr:hypothetical protein [Candidatus Uhrbacteria bacterium]